VASKRTPAIAIAVRGPMMLAIGSLTVSDIAHGFVESQ